MLETARSGLIFSKATDTPVDTSREDRLQMTQRTPAPHDPQYAKDQTENHPNSTAASVDVPRLYENSTKLIWSAKYSCQGRNGR